MTPFSVFRPLAPAAVRPLLLAVATCLGAACASTTHVEQAQATAAPGDSHSIGSSGRGRGAEPSPELPNQDLTGDVLYEFLLGEIAGQRGNLALAAQTYADLAKRTRDPRVAGVRSKWRCMRACRRSRSKRRRSGPSRAPAAAGRLPPRRAAGRREARRRSRAVAGEAARGGGRESRERFMQLNRLLASNPDKATNLRVVQRPRAAKYPKLPQAHFAVGAGRRRSPATMPAALQRSRAGAGAAARLGARGDARGAGAAEDLAGRGGEAAGALRREVSEVARGAPRTTRACWSLDKRLPEARKQFEQLLRTTNPRQHRTSIYAVGLLAFQVKEYRGAEANMKRVLDLGYRDPKACAISSARSPRSRSTGRRRIAWYERDRSDSDHELPARMRTANAIAKQGKLDEARAYLRRSPPSSPSERAQLIVAEAQLLRDANRHERRVRAARRRRSASSPTSPTSCTTTRSPPRSSSASTCSRRTCAS